VESNFDEQFFSIFWIEKSAQIPASCIDVDFVPYAAYDYYAEYSFDNPGSPDDCDSFSLVTPSGTSGQLRIGIRNDEWSNYQANDDYSYLPNAVVTEKINNKMTLYWNGELVWGIEPPGAP
jgi:hypothetical protein